MKQALLALSFLFFAMSATATDNLPPASTDVQAVEDSSLSTSQSAVLMTAKATALASCTVKTDCDSLMRLVVGITWQETRADAYGPVGDFDNGPMDRSYGPMQVKLKNALQILSWNPRLRRTYFGDRPYKLGKHTRIINQGPRTVTEEEVLALLVANPQFNLYVGTDLIKYLHYELKLSWAETVRAYNQGVENRNSDLATFYFKQYQDGEHSKTVSAVLKRP